VSVRQLYQLQCIEFDIESREQALARDKARLGESEELRQAQARLAKARAEMDALVHQQKENDWAISDLSAKMTVTKESLYSGRVRNPKELTGLQQELDALKRQRDPLEEKALDMMEQVEAAQADIKKLEEELTAAEARSKEEQKTLHAEIDSLQAQLASLQEKRQHMVGVIPPDEMRFYTGLKVRRGVAVAKVEQGTCGRCRLALSSAEIQRTRSGTMVQCSSCSCILFFE